MMDLRKAKACILRVGGTNCDAEVKAALEDLGLRSDILHMDWLEKGKLSEYQLLVFPGGFSYGDYVRAGAVWGKKVLTKMRRDLERFVEEGRLVMGICNGFQVLVEAGMLPGDEGAFSPTPKAVLANNSSARYECRWVFLRGKGATHHSHEGLAKARSLGCRSATGRAGSSLNQTRRSRISSAATGSSSGMQSRRESPQKGPIHSTPTVPSTTSPPYATGRGTSWA